MISSFIGARLPGATGGPSIRTWPLQRNLGPTRRYRSSCRSTRSGSDGSTSAIGTWSSAARRRSPRPCGPGGRRPRQVHPTRPCATPGTWRRASRARASLGRRGWPPGSSARGSSAGTRGRRPPPRTSSWRTPRAVGDGSGGSGDARRKSFTRRCGSRGSRYLSATMASCWSPRGCSRTDGSTSRSEAANGLGRELVVVGDAPRPPACARSPDHRSAPRTGSIRSALVDLFARCHAYLVPGMRGLRDRTRGGDGRGQARCRACGPAARSRRWSRESAACLFDSPTVDALSRRRSSGWIRSHSIGRPSALTPSSSGPPVFRRRFVELFERLGVDPSLYRADLT